MAESREQYRQNSSRQVSQPIEESGKAQDSIGKKKCLGCNRFDGLIAIQPLIQLVDKKNEHVHVMRSEVSMLKVEQLVCSIWQTGTRPLGDDF
jgi:hypothetical protein